MATYFARKAGNINATDVWATTPSGTAGAQTFASGDVLVANSFTITVNVSTDLGATGEVRNDTTGGATAGGSFSLSNGVTLTANVFAGSAVCVTTAGSVAATIVGNLTGGTGSGANAVRHQSSGTLAVTGAVTGGTNVSHGIRSEGTGTITVTGNVSGASSGIGVFLTSTSGNVVIVGNVTGGSGSTFCQGVFNEGAATVTVTGNVTGGTNATAPGLANTGTGSVTVTGTIAGNVGIGLSNTSSGSVTIVGRAKGGPLATSSVGASNSTTGTVTLDELEFGDTGMTPTSGPIRVAAKTSNVCLVYQPAGTKKTLVDVNSTTLLPAASDVRFGTTYNSGATTGTCRVPSAANVLQGVLVDNTTGTAIMTPAGFWDYLTSSATTAGSMGERLKNCATVTSTGQQIADAVGA